MLPGDLAETTPIEIRSAVAPKTDREDTARPPGHHSACTCTAC